MSGNFAGQATAERALRANLSPRYFRLDKLQRYVEGTQYEGRPNFWSPGADVPLLERAPAIVSPIVQAAINSNVDLCLGEGRWPQITSVSASGSFDPRLAMTEDDAEIVDGFLDAAIHQAKLKTVAADALGKAQACGTSVAIVGVKCGKLCVELVDAKWCSGEFDYANGRQRVAKLTIQYPYLEEYKDSQSGRWDVRCLIYRRVIDAVSDTTYKPMRAEVSGVEPADNEWAVDTKVEHNLGFCPVVWYRFMAECATVEQIDGNAIHRNLLDEIDCLNFGLSQRHRAALYSTDPIIVELGVDKDYSPSELGREPRIITVSDDAGGRFGVTGFPRPARKKGPSVVWGYPNPDTKVQMLTLPGDALKAADDNARDLRAKIAEGLSVVFTDPENMRISSDISGKALAWLHSKQTSRCDRYRDDFADGWLFPVLGMCMRIAVLSAPGSLRIPGLSEASAVLSRFYQPTQGTEGTEGTVEWFEPELVLYWGDYFKPTEADQKQIFDSVIGLQSAGLLTKKAAVQRLQPFFDIDSVDEFLEELAKEESGHIEQMHSDLAGMVTDGGDAETGAEEGTESEPVSSPLGRSGVLGAADADG